MGHQALPSGSLRGAGSWLDLTALSSPRGALGPLLSSAHGQWGLFLLAQLENTHGPATLPCHISRLFAHRGASALGGSIVTPLHLSVTSEGGC